MDESKFYGLFFKGDFDNYYLGHQAEEIFKSRLYAPFLEQKADATVLDIGGNIGMFSLYASKYAKQVYTLEPSKDQFETIQKMVEFNGLKNVKPINKAIYIDNATYAFHHNTNKTMYSLHQAVADGSSAPEQVEAISLDKLFEDEGITHVDLMKLDIEGSEIEVLSSAGFRKVADKIDVVVTERHAWAGRNPNQLDEALKINGFTVHTVPNDADIVIGVRGG